MFRLAAVSVTIFTASCTGARGITPTTLSSQTATSIVKSVSVERDIPYCTAGGASLGMDLYRPARTKLPLPVVMYVHGGSWSADSKEEADSAYAGRWGTVLATRGYLVASVNYRLAPAHRFPAQIEDVKCALRFLRAHAATLGIDANRMGVLGVSTGGHLAALAGVTDTTAGWDHGEHSGWSSGVQAVVTLAGIFDLARELPVLRSAIETAFGTSETSSALLCTASPVTYVTEGDPPFLIVQGMLDRIVPPEQAGVLASRLAARNVPVTAVYVRNAGHGFVRSRLPMQPTAVEIQQLVVRFLDQHLI